MRDFLARWFSGSERADALNQGQETTGTLSGASVDVATLKPLPLCLALVRLDSSECVATEAFMRLREYMDWQEPMSLRSWLKRQVGEDCATVLAQTGEWRGERAIGEQRYLMQILPVDERDAWFLLTPLPAETPAEISERILDQASVGIAFVQSGKVVRVNHKFSELFLYEPASILGHSLERLFPRLEQAENVLSIVQEALAEGGEFEHELYLQRQTGGEFWCNLSIKPLDGIGLEQGEIWLFKDASLHKGIEDHLRQAAVVFESSSDGIIILDARRNIKMVNSSFTRITGYTGDEVLGKNPRLLNSGKQTAEFYERLWAHVERRGPWQGEISNRRKNGEQYPEWCSITPVRNNSGEIVEFVMIFSDITQRKQIENRLRYQANFDGLTDLPNRSLFMDRLSQGLVRVRREGTALALLFIDLDRFKNINDTLGHSAGDKLLVAVAKELRGCIRESDTIARFGGDEFAVILSPIYGPKNASTVGQNLLKVLSQPFDIDGYEAIVGGSIGITLYPNDGTTAEELVKNADAAMYRAKEQGRNNYQFFTSEMQQAALARMTLERDLRYAVERKELLLYFQPQLGVRSGYVAGLEVLVRWLHPTRGMVSPVDFISLAEDTGLIVGIGEWVLRSACQQFHRWQERGIAPERMAVNVSGRQFNARNFVSTVREILNESGLDPHCLELELTESVLMKDEERVIDTLNQLRAMGILISIDDFGTGYSSLSYLKRFPISTLKIDRSFVMDTPGDSDDSAIVKAIIDMAHTLKMEVVAEGVENEQQVEFLRGLDCDYIQGYLYGRPMPGEQCGKFLTLERASAWASSAPGREAIKPT